jgi:hypothetical protein
MNKQKRSKVCARCGRLFEERKKWRLNWEQVVFCSTSCRQSKKDDFEIQILEALKKRGKTSTICPSEILPFEQKTDKNIMEDVRRAARRLVEQGKIDILQKGQVVDPSSFRGPIRLRIKSQ